LAYNTYRQRNTALYFPSVGLSAHPQHCAILRPIETVGLHLIAKISNRSVSAYNYHERTVGLFRIERKN